MTLANMSVINIARYFVSFSVFMFLALSVSFKGSYGYSGTLILLSYLFLLSREVRQQIALSRMEKGLVIVLSMYLVSMILEVVCYSLPIKEIDSESKILLFLPLIFLLNAVKINPKVIVFGLAVGCLGLFSLAVYEKHILGLDRVGSFINAIQLGNIAMTFGLLSCVFSFCMSRSNKRYNVIRWLLIVVGLGAVYGSLTTLTRGGLVFLPIIILIVSIYFRREMKRHWQKVVVGGVVIATGITALIVNSSIEKRIESAVGNVGAYFENGKATTSPGVRLELWKAALLIAKDNPVFGVGENQYLDLKKELIEKGELAPSILRYGHSHNAYFYALVRRGAAGLLFLLLLLSFPVIIAHRELRSSENRKRASSVGLMVFGLFFAFANLTQVLFAHNSGMIMYTGLLILLVNFNLAHQKANEEALSSQG